MPTSVWIALLFILGATWILLRVLRKPAPPPAPARRPGAPVYAPPGAATPKPAGMVVTQMSTHGFLRIDDAAGTREEPLPASPLGEGEFPTAVWAAPDHTVFAVGKQYTGQPGPDDGVVWRRDPDGTWSTAFRLQGRTFHSVAGRASTDVIVGAIGGIALFDGSAWRVELLPAYSMMWNVWQDGDDLVAQAFDDSAAVLVAGGVTRPCPPRPRPDRDRYEWTVDGARYRVFDRSEEVGPRVLDPREETELRAEMAQVQQILAAREAAARR